MSVLFLLIGVGVVFVAGLLAVGRLGDLPATPTDRAAVDLPVGPVSADDVEGVRFPVVIRGYRMTDVDRAIDRLRRELADRDARLAVVDGPGGAHDPGHRGYSNEHTVT